MGSLFLVKKVVIPPGENLDFLKFGGDGVYEGQRGLTLGTPVRC
jgi:hypothetical protein